MVVTTNNLFASFLLKKYRERDKKDRQKERERRRERLKGAYQIASQKQLFIVQYYNLHFVRGHLFNYILDYYIQTNHQMSPLQKEGHLYYSITYQTIIYRPTIRYLYCRKRTFILFNYILDYYIQTNHQMSPLQIEDIYTIQLYIRLLYIDQPSDVSTTARSHLYY